MVTLAKVHTDLVNKDNLSEESADNYQMRQTRQMSQSLLDNRSPLKSSPVKSQKSIRSEAQSAMVKLIREDETWSKLESLYHLGKEKGENGQITFRNHPSQTILDEIEQEIEEQQNEPTSSI